MECCVCEINENHDETQIKKKYRQLPLKKRPEVLFLPFANTFQTICIRCNNMNNLLITNYIEEKKRESTHESSLFQPKDFIKCIYSGKTNHCKLICNLLQPDVCVLYHEPVTGNTALHICAKNGYWHLAKFLLERRKMNVIECKNDDDEYDDNDDDLRENMVSQRRKKVNLKNKTNLTMLDAKDQYNRTCLHIACSINYRSDLVELFCQSGSDLNMYCNDTTPLMLAIGCGSSKMIKVLYKYGVHINQRTQNDGKTALMKAVALGEVKCCQMLLKLGANIEYVDHLGLNVYDLIIKRKVLNENYTLIKEILLKESKKKKYSFATKSGKNTELHSKVVFSNYNDDDTDSTKDAASASIKYGYQARMKRKAEMIWQEQWDELAEEPYWWNIETNETTWDCPEFLERTYYPEDSYEMLSEEDEENDEKDRIQSEIEFKKKQNELLRNAKKKITLSYVLPKLSSYQQKKKEEEAFLLDHMKEEFKGYNSMQKNIVQKIKNEENFVENHFRILSNNLSEDPPIEDTVKKRLSSSNVLQKKKGSIAIRPMNPPLYYHSKDNTLTANKDFSIKDRATNEGISYSVDRNNYKRQPTNKYKTYEDPGIDFPLHSISTNPIDKESYHVWPGNYKRSGMNGRESSIGTLHNEMNEIMNEMNTCIGKPSLYSKRSLSRAQFARDWFRKVRRDEIKSNPGSYALYTNESEIRM